MSENTSDQPEDASLSSPAAHGSETRSASGAVSRGPVRVQAQPRWLAPAALLVAVVATALAIWALVGKSSDASAATAGTGTGDPKSGVCTTFATVSNAVSLQTHNDLGPDPIPQAAVAGNARLALFGGGQYLLNSIQPDTPDELAQSARSFAGKLQAVGMNALAGKGNADPEQAPLLADAEQDRKKIADLCK
ncbi:MAG TPA: hypothetical protein VJR50_23835 [Mycobacterium sp.]|nr:hypothetical protein [Mycobacterium sp.]